MYVRLASDQRFVFIVAMILGFIFPGVSSFSSQLILPALVVMMTVSLRKLSFREIKGFSFKHAGILFALSMIGLSALHILLAKLMIANLIYQHSIILLGIAPPAIGIVAMSYILGGDVKLAFAETAIAYLASVFMMPFLAYLFIGSGANPKKIFSIVCLLVILPFILSRLLRKIDRGLFNGGFNGGNGGNLGNSGKEGNGGKKGSGDDAGRKRISRASGSSGTPAKIAINACYAVIIYSVIGMNKAVVVSNFASLIPIAAMLILVKFPAGVGIYLFLRNRMERPLAVDYALFGSMKNGSAIIGIAIAVLGAKAAIPQAVNALVEIPFILAMNWLMMSKDSKD